MKQICSILLFFLISAGSYAQNFADYFQNKTLRVDYIFTGNNKQQEISPPDSVSTRLPFLLCFRSGCPPMKPRKQPKGSKIHSCFPTPNSRQR